jgi:hypothetical protein
MNDFRATYLPYCLIRQNDGRYAVTNRRYKPVGLTTTQHVEYQQYPVLAFIKKMGTSTIKKLSWNASEDSERIYLYNDGCNPVNSAKDMHVYLDRLAILAKLEISLEP